MVKEIIAQAAKKEKRFDERLSLIHIFVARVDPRSTSRTGDTVKVAFETNRLHFFDKDTELSILNH